MSKAKSTEAGDFPLVTIEGHEFDWHSLPHASKVRVIERGLTIVMRNAIAGLGVPALSKLSAEALNDEATDAASRGYDGAGDVESLSAFLCAEAWAAAAHGLHTGEVTRGGGGRTGPRARGIEKYENDEAVAYLKVVYASKGFVFPSGKGSAEKIREKVTMLRTDGRYAAAWSDIAAKAKAKYDLDRGTAGVVSDVADDLID